MAFSKQNNCIDLYDIQFNLIFVDSNEVTAKKGMNKKKINKEICFRIKQILHLRFHKRFYI